MKRKPIFRCWMGLLLVLGLIAPALDAHLSTADAASLASTAPAHSLQEVLHADGTLNLPAGFSGTLDPQGWTMQTLASGAPRFVRSAPTVAGDENWDSRFTLPGPNGWGIEAIAISGTTVYVGGNFTNIAGVNASRIAAWNGNSWQTLSTGMDNDVLALAVSGGILYAGGFFSTAGGVTVNSIAAWDGSSWQALGAGMDNYVYALAVSGGILYAGGTFTRSGGVPANYIAKWNGSQWSALGSGLSSGSGRLSAVSALTVSGTDLYVGGTFTTAGSVAVNNIAKWNGTVWSALGSGTNQKVNALAMSGGTLYAGGYFTAAGGITGTSHIASWDGTRWRALGNGLDFDMYTLVVSEGLLYAGGSFTTAGGVLVNHVAIWNGSTWAALGSGVGDGVWALAMSRGTLYAGGQFTTAGEVRAIHIATWNGSTWTALAPDLRVNNDVYTLAVSGGLLYAGGAFTAVGEVPVNYIAAWNGTAWSALGSGLDGAVQALAVSGGTLYAGGVFTQAGGGAVAHIAAWNGTAWSALGAGTNYAVYTLVVNGGTLYVGGQFTQAGGVAAAHIAAWTRGAWNALGSGLNGAVSALAVSGDTLYAGGWFTQAGGMPANNIAAWNGRTWSALGSGTDYDVYALAVSGSILYAGGGFGHAGGVTAYGVAAWNGTAWQALGSGLNAYVYALAADGGTLYAGGWFTQAGGIPAQHIAAWNGRAWSVLGSGTDDPVYALAVKGADLDVGGHFTQAGGQPSSYFGIWHGITWANAVNTDGASSTLTKTGGGTGWNAGASSQLNILSGDGYAEFRPADTTSYVTVGLSHGDTNQTYQDIDFGWYLNGGTHTLRIYENGTLRGSFGSYAVGDILRVAVESGSVRYYQNGVLKYTSARPPIYPLLLDASLFTPGAQIGGAHLGGMDLGSLPNPVTWTHLTGATATDTRLTKPVGIATGWNAGGVSKKQITSGAGYAQFTVADTTNYVSAGLSTGDSNATYQDIDFGWYLNGGTHTLRIYENGTLRGSFGSYAVGDILRVAVESGSVRYYQNGVLKYTSARPPTYPLLLDASLFTPGAQIGGAQLAGASLTDMEGALTLPPTAVAFKNGVNVISRTNTLTRTTVPAGWTAGAVSDQSIAVGGEGYVQARVDMTTTNVMFGLSTGDTNVTYADIDFAWYMHLGQLLVYEAGVAKGSFGVYAAGDVLRVEVASNVVRYYQNGTLRYTSARPPIFPLLLDSSLYTPNARLLNAQIAGSSLAPSPPAPPGGPPAKPGRPGP